MTNPCNSCELQGFLFMTYRSVTEWTSHTALRRGIQGYPFMSFRAATRNPEIPAKAGTRKRHFTGPRIECGVCSFFSAARRTNQEAPPLLSGFVGRRLAPSSGAAELAALRQSSPSLLGRLASSRPDKGGVYRYDAEAWAYCTWRGVDVIPRPRNTRSCPTALRRGIQVVPAVACQNVHAGNRTRWRRRRKYGMKMGAERYRDTDSGAYRPPGWRLVQFL